VRAYDGPIDQNLGTIDTESLSLTVNMEDSAAVRPAGGSYPPGERVPVSVTAEPGFVFRHWEDAAGGGVPNSRSRDTWLMMDGPRSLDVIMRLSYSQPEHSYGEAPYDSTYTPHGVTSVNLTGLINSYTPVHGSTQSYFPARVRITAQDFPMDDPMREVVLSGIDDVWDAGRAPISFAWPAGTVLTIQAEPYAHPAGFDHILLAWNTSPGTAINQCPTPEQEHSFTVPPLNPGQTLQLSLVTGVVNTYVNAGAEVPFPGVHFDVTFNQSHGTATYSYLDTTSIVIHYHEVIGPKGATQEMEVSFHEHQSRRMERVLGGMGWGYAPMIVNGELTYPPFNGFDTQIFPINVHGDLGDTQFTLNGEFVSGQVEAQEGSNPGILYAANKAKEPGSGTMRSSDSTAIVEILTQFNPQTNKPVLYDAYAVPTVSVETDVIVVDHEGNEVQASVPPGFVTDPHKYAFDPGDDRFSTFMQPGGRPGETAWVEAISNPMFNHIGWVVDGVEYDLEGNELNGGQQMMMMTSGSTHYQLTFMGSQLALGILFGCAPAPKFEPVEVEAKFDQNYILAVSGTSQTSHIMSQACNSLEKLEAKDLPLKKINSMMRDAFLEELWNGYPRIKILYFVGHKVGNGIGFDNNTVLTKQEIQYWYSVAPNEAHSVVHISGCDTNSLFNYSDWKTQIFVAWNDDKVKATHAKQDDEEFWRLVIDLGMSFRDAQQAVSAFNRSYWERQYGDFLIPELVVSGTNIDTELNDLLGLNN